MVDKLDIPLAKTAALLFGKELSPFSKYEEWLGQRLPGGKRVKSVLGTGEAYLPEYGCFKKAPEDKVASYEDLSKAGQPLLDNTENISLSDLVSAVQEKAYFVPTYTQGNNVDVEDSFGYIDCLNVRHAFDPFYSKNSAYALSIANAESSFGLYRCMNPKFSIHLYNSWDIQRCFEMDSSNKCTDSMFCHNVENLTHCLFCFNTKSKRYAIGNVEVGKEKYTEFRSMLCAEIVKQLEETGKLGFDIYDVLGKVQ